MTDHAAMLQQYYRLAQATERCMAAVERDLAQSGHTPTSNHMYSTVHEAASGSQKVANPR